MLLTSRFKSKTTPPKIKKDVVLKPFKLVIFSADSMKLGTIVMNASIVAPINVILWISCFK